MAVLGGNRIPFARSNSVYADASNQDMLTAAIDGLVDRFGLEGERLGEVVAGAVLKHTRDFNLTRESVLGSKLSPETPATDIQQACGTGLQAAIQVANKIALGQIDVGIAGGTDTTSDAPVAISDKLRKKLMKVNSARDTRGPADGAGADPPGRHRPVDPAERRAADPPVDGRARRAHRAGVEDLAGRAGRAGRCVAPAPRRGVRRGLPRRPGHAVPRASSATRTCGPTPRSRSSATLKPVFGKGEAATMTAGNSTPLTDGASDGAARRRRSGPRRTAYRPLAYLRASETAAVDYVHGGEGLLMAPAYAVPRMLAREGLTLQDFDFYEIHEAFASQVLATLKAWEDPVFCKERLGLDEPLGADRPVEAERQRLVAGGGPPVRRDRRPDRQRRRQAAGRAGVRARR